MASGNKSQELEELSEIIESLEALSGRIQKIDIGEENKKSFADLLKSLYYRYDDFVENKSK
jgi:ATP-dependent Clp protease ATP-binding subunit ClpA